MFFFNLRNTLFPDSCSWVLTFFFFLGKMQGHCSDLSELLPSSKNANKPFTVLFFTFLSHGSNFITLFQDTLLGCLSTSLISTLLCYSERLLWLDLCSCLFLVFWFWLEGGVLRCSVTLMLVNLYLASLSPFFLLDFLCKYQARFPHSSEIADCRLRLSEHLLLHIVFIVSPPSSCSLY